MNLPLNRFSTYTYTKVENIVLPKWILAENPILYFLIVLTNICLSELDTIHFLSFLNGFNCCPLSQIPLTNNPSYSSSLSSYKNISVWNNFENSKHINVSINDLYNIKFDFVKSLNFKYNDISFWCSYYPLTTNKFP